MQRLVKGDFRRVFHAAVGKRLVFFHVKVGTDILYSVGFSAQKEEQVLKKKKEITHFTQIARVQGVEKKSVMF